MSSSSSSSSLDSMGEEGINNDKMESSDSDGEYFESSSQSSNRSLTGENNGISVPGRMSAFRRQGSYDSKKLYSLDSNNEQSLRKMNFAQRSSGMNDKLLFQINTEELFRQELGGIVVYDSYARINGNMHLTKYYEANLPQKVDFDMLFTKQEQALADKLFYKEARERDFQCDFDKFLFKHLPKFGPQRDYSHSGQQNFTQNQGLGGQPQHSFTINVPNQENTLIFDSRFESANLRRAIKVNNIEYNLWLENDVNTKGHTQWFHFKVFKRACDKKQKIQFNILNLAKPQSLYQLGMKICVNSKRQNSINGRGWHRGGEDVKYFQNGIPRKTPNNCNGGTAGGTNQILINNNGAGEGLEYYFTLSFIYEFEQDEDEVYFAQALPFTFTDLQKDMIELQSKADGKNILNYNILCKELSGSAVPLITITDQVDTYLDYYDIVQLNKELPNVVRKQFHKKYMKSKKLLKQSLESKGKVRRLLMAAFEEEINSFYENNADIFKSIDDNHNTNGEGAIFGRRYDNFNTKLKQYIIDHYHKKAIIITSRVHPGEPQASYMMQGMLDYLISDEASELRKHFVFRIVPMLNVDGVIYGNQRCSLLGVDLNRRWVSPNMFLHPTIFHSKQMIRQMHNERRVLMYCDLHGHSRRQNAFYYACSYKNYEHEGRIKNAQLRMIPLLCCHKSPDFYKFQDCRFRIEKCKESTARVVIFREFNIMNAFTLESSFFGKEPEIINTQSGNPEDERRSSLPPQKAQHFTIADYRIIGQSLPQVLNNFLPREQSKLELLSGKILEIFYEEFVKLIPPYVLKREEEKKRQLMGLESQQEQVITAQSQQLQINPAPYSGSQLLIQKTPNNKQTSSPRFSLNSNQGIPFNQLQQVSTFTRAQTIKRVKAPQMDSTPSTSIQPLQPMIKKQPLMKLPTTALISSQNPQAVTTPQQTAKKKKPKKQLTMISKKDIAMSEGKQQESVKKEGTTGTETDTFSQIMKIHGNQEELIDLESFIKGENVKLKFYEQKLRDNGDDLDEEEIAAAASDSSGDSDESSKNLFAMQQQEEIIQLQAKQKATKKQSFIKKPALSSQKKNLEDEVMRSLDNTRVNPGMAKYKRAGSKVGMVHGMENFKFRPVGKSTALDMHSRQNLRSFTNKTMQKRDNLVAPQSSSVNDQNIFDKISHKPSQSPVPLIIQNEEIAEVKTSAQDYSSDQDLIHESLLVLEDPPQQNPTQQSQVLLYQSYEDLRSNPAFTNQHEKHRPQQHILPLYESPAYHQNRLSSITSSQERNYFHYQPPQQQQTQGSILYQNVKQTSNPFVQFGNHHFGTHKATAPNRNQVRQSVTSSHTNNNNYEPYIDHQTEINQKVRQLQIRAAPIANSVTNPGFGQQFLNRPSTQQELSFQTNKQGLIIPSSTNPKQSYEIDELSKKVRQSQQMNNSRQRQANATYERDSTTSRQKYSTTQDKNNEAIQRISFKELLESSRQQRVVVDKQNITAIKNYNPKLYQGHVINSNLQQMFKNLKTTQEQQLPESKLTLNSQTPNTQALNSLQHTQRELKQQNIPNTLKVHIVDNQSSNIIVVNKKDIQSTKKLILNNFIGSVAEIPESKTPQKQEQSMRQSSPLTNGQNANNIFYVRPQYAVNQSFQQQSVIKQVGGGFMRKPLNVSSVDMKKKQH